jgi:hypothetical protein
MRPDHTVTWGEPVTRRFALIVGALLTTTSVVLAACQTAPAAPLLSDPKEILTESVVSLKDVTTVEFTGSFTGTLEAAELGGTFDLSSIKITGALDVPNKKAKLNVDAPELMGTAIDAIVLEDAAYLKIDGLLAGMLGGTAGKYTKTDIPASSGEPINDPAEIAKAVDEFRAALDKLPAPTKAADEQCGDQTCYHVTVSLSAEDLAALDPTTAEMAGTGDMTLDLWTRQSDRLPAKVAMNVTSPEIGTVGMTFEFRYGGSVSVAAPPAAEIAP